MTLSVASAREGAPAIFPKLTVLSVLTVIAFFALPFHNAPHRSPAFQAFAFKTSQPLEKAPAPSVFEQEMAMGPKHLLDRWNPFIAEASRRFGIPQSWIRAIVSRESGGRTMLAEQTPIVSDAGAVGVMQIMPQTYEEMRAQYNLGADPTDPHDNIIAGSAYLSWLYKSYGFPDMFAAYNDGPGNFDKYRDGSRSLPAETVAYLASMKANLDPPRRTRSRSRAA